MKRIALSLFGLILFLPALGVRSNAQELTKDIALVSDRRVSVMLLSSDKKEVDHLAIPYRSKTSVPVRITYQLIGIPSFIGKYEILIQKKFSPSTIDPDDIDEMRKAHDELAEKYKFPTSISTEFRNSVPLRLQVINYFVTYRSLHLERIQRLRYAKNIESKPSRLILTPYDVTIEGKPVKMMALDVQWDVDLKLNASSLSSLIKPISIHDKGTSKTSDAPDTPDAPAPDSSKDVSKWVASTLGIPGGGLLGLEKIGVELVTGVAIPNNGPDAMGALLGTFGKESPYGILAGRTFTHDRWLIAPTYRIGGGTHLFYGASFSRTNGSSTDNTTTRLSPVLGVAFSLSRSSPPSPQKYSITVENGDTFRPKVMGWQVFIDKVPEKGVPLQDNYVHLEKPAPASAK